MTKPTADLCSFHILVNVISNRVALLQNLLIFFSASVIGFRLKEASDTTVVNWKRK